MSAKYAKVKKYYDNGLWSLAWVRDAVTKGQITADEYEAITGEAYDADEDN